MFKKLTKTDLQECLFFLKEEEDKKPDTKLTSYKGHSVTIENARTLGPKIWLLDPILHYIMFSFQAMFASSNKTTRVFPSFFFTKVLQDGHPIEDGR
jgi:Ulp1 family protease